MEMNDLILISIDDHIVEPPDMFDRHIPAAYKDKAPKMLREDKADRWVFEGRILPNVGLNGVAGRPREEYGVEPAALKDMRPGCWNVKERVNDMNANGVLASVNFATFPGFCGTLFATAKDKQAAYVIVQAYNDWHIDEWCAAAPGRFIPNAILPLWDVGLCVQEAKRVLAKGCHSLGFPDNPYLKGLPSIHTDHWDPLWKFMSDNRMVISTHIGTGNAPPVTSPDAPFDVWCATMPSSIAVSATDWLFSPVFKKFPELKIALSEGGIGWIPYILERSDFTYEHHRAWTNANFNGKLPSDVFLKNFMCCFIDDDFGLQNINHKFMNPKMVAWECDYPHSDCTWPNAAEYVWKGIKDLPRHQIDDITHLNVMREFSFDPFAAMGGRDKCTVGALRAQAAKDGVSTAPTHGLGGFDPSHKDGTQVTIGEVMQMFAEAEN